MKQCPVCQSTYTDDTLVFCLNDGGKLFSPSSAEATREMSFGNRQTFQASEPKTAETLISAPKTIEQTRNKGTKMLVLLALLGVAAVVLAGIGIIGFFILGKDDSKQEALSVNQTPAPTRNSDQTQELKEKLDRLEKQLEEEQRKANKNLSLPTPAQTQTTQNPVSSTGKVNSPNDGFLSLRSAPNHKTGGELVRIPHGTSVTVFNCQAYKTIAGRRGRWCQATFGGKTGWVFDGFLAY